MRVCWCWCQDKCQLGQNNELHNLHLTDIPPQHSSLNTTLDLHPPLSGVTGQLGSGPWLSSASLPIKAPPGQAESVGLITQTQVEYSVFSIEDLEVLQLISRVQACYLTRAN